MDGAVYVPLPLTGTDSVLIAVAQLVSPGPYSWNVSEPPGTRPPASTALSLMTPPIWIDGDAVVDGMDGFALGMVIVAPDRSLSSEKNADWPGFTPPALAVQD